MKYMLNVIAACCVAFTAYFLFSSPETRLKIALKTQTGSSKDVFVMKREFGYGEAQPVVLVFGYIDDYDVCLQLISDHYKNYPQTPEGAFFCQPAN